MKHASQAGLLCRARQSLEDPPCFGPAESRPLGAIENEPERKGNRADQGQEEGPAGTETNGEPLSVVPLSATMLVRSASYWVGWPALCLAGQLWQGVAERAAWVATNDHRHT
jgi:hypothetical protein